MFRRSLIVVALAILTASCSSSDVLATVNGEHITKEDVYALDPAYEDALGSRSGEDLRSAVSSLIVLQAQLHAAEEEFGVIINDSMIDDLLANPPERYQQTLNPAIPQENVTPQILRFRATALLLLDQVGPALMEREAGGFAELYATRPDIVSRVCVRHIAVATVEEGEQVMARLEAGEEFEALVAELSIDTNSPGGLLLGNEPACPLYLSGIGGEFSRLAATADLNVPLGPIAGPIGFSVFRIEERVAPASIAELEQRPMDFLQTGVVGTIYSSWASDAARNAEVDVASSLGRWSADGFGIAPPE